VKAAVRWGRVKNGGFEADDADLAVSPSVLDAGID
jgi:hypothetical protein